MPKLYSHGKNKPFFIKKIDKKEEKTAKSQFLPF